jgi:LPXTG-motif cell wall-anchored protein
MVGGLVRLAFDKLKKNEDAKKDIVNDGILFCSGMIAGEGLVGILLALFAVFGIADAIDISGRLNLPSAVSNVLSLMVFGLIVLSLLVFSVWKKRKKQ